MNSQISKARNHGKLSLNYSIGIEDLEQSKNNFSDEEFKFTEDSLISLAKGEQTMIDFMEKNEINDILEWASERRSILLTSDRIFSNLESPSKLPDTDFYYK